ncbi:hypothetical protein [Prosthecomicrobium hirschii]|uniref:hypothetical protein n=1 Tax=Prosthecodimorpha hirschii TaxID=665126 RepID=UPI00221FC93F|nr:hypothetical protein [Prosthecomicrobium hirschii]MCW1838736.1 hypothetical protein [Prosthecomicrobium hirschii]
MSEDRFAKAIAAAARARAGQAAERATGIARAAETRSKNLQPAPSMKPAREEAPQPVNAPIKSTAPAAQAAPSARLFRAYRKPAGGYEIAPSANAALPAGAKAIEDAALHAQLAAAGWTGVALYSCGFITGTAPAS